METQNNNFNDPTIPIDPTVPDYIFSHSLIQGHAPLESEIKFSIGPYKIIELIGKGGMGEVYLAYDTLSGRKIALKRIRTDLLDYKQINNRFLKEAHVTSQLTHPSIIPIYSIHKEASEIYYTMPFVKGETLKEMLKTIRKNIKKGKKASQHSGSIPSLIRIFINVCQAIAYSHSKKVLHRDLKPENIIVGQYGEVLILDWGLAKLIRDNDESDKNQVEEEDFTLPQPNQMHLSGITRVGKVVGTVNYMAPERALGKISTYQTDIYSLGVILYQILTLRYPFLRGTLEEFRKNMDKELIPDPIEIAPYRDIPQVLAKIAMKCLEVDPKNRYLSVDELIKDVESYIEGRADWFHMASLNPKDKSDWEFQENIYLQDHGAVTRSDEACDWMSLMISKASFTENIMIEARLKFKEEGHGLGFLFSVPESSERRHLNDGYCLWISSEMHRSTKLMRSTMEVIYAPETALKYNEWYNIKIDKVDSITHFYLNNKLQFSYISHLPFVGTHVGLISRDFNYEIEDFNVHVGGQNVMVKCLAVPDAFLAHKQYDIALSEYRRIGYSFKGRDEGREALFRAGITLLEQAKNQSGELKSTDYYDLALKEFEKLYQTPGAPLEYLGKALVYQALKEYDEEIKCFELGCRKYPKHPLLSILHEQIIFRMHECSRIHRKATYQFILLAIRLFHEITVSKHVKKLFDSLQRHWEPLPFIIEIDDSSSTQQNKSFLFSITLAFWLGKPFVIEEIIQDILKQQTSSPNLIGNALICMIKLGSWRLAEKNLDSLQSKKHEQIYSDLEFIIKSEKNLNQNLVFEYCNTNPSMNCSSERVLLHMMEAALRTHQESIVHYIYEMFYSKCSEENKLLFDAYECQALFYEQKWNEGSQVLRKYPIETLSQETSILYILYGCWLLISEGKEMAQIHFSGLMETSYPRTWCLLGHFLTKRFQDDLWIERFFSWEKRQLYSQLQLYYHILESKDLEEKYRLLEINEVLDIF